ncbi:MULTISPECIES: cytochrome c oxidase subunit 2A [Bacillales]|uniref:cytochrome c oxidase subunit 2A n=1 Tax=Bacillales TaxID=1385 RepID=UPI0018837B2C|nr:cytochrome c oxidase subunit 2A [Pseudalkalibacillus hwajinpoensis]MBF0706121.1 cytochrome c oxidase subunit 2A [Pseudalkalibacillus hwajinpoensis]WLR60937.1 cytochrome c oxidase subunit 2A [Pseudalkalibacillus hwajinpoensis]
MGALEEKKETARKVVINKGGPNLKGTMVAVMLLGGFILLSWFGVYWLYMVRL